MSDAPGSTADGGGEAARLLVAAARRRDAALRQLGVDPAHRLSEWQLSTIRRLIAGLVGVVEDELRTGLAARFESHPSLHASLSSREVALAAPVMQRVALATEGDLLAQLMRRLEEHRLQRAAVDKGALGPLAALVGDGDEAVAADAMAVLIAQSRRLDRFQEPLMARTELPAELEHKLLWSVAAALRHYILRHHGIAPAVVDEAIAAETSALLARYDEGDTLEARCMRLARRLAEVGRIDDGLLEASISGGSLAFFISAIAVRSGFGFAATADILADPDSRGAPLLLRAGEVARPVAAAILLALAAGAETALAAQLDLFDAARVDEARDALTMWRIDPAYRAAVRALLLADAA